MSNKLRRNAKAPPASVPKAQLGRTEGPAKHVATVEAPAVIGTRISGRRREGGHQVGRDGEDLLNYARWILSWSGWTFPRDSWVVQISVAGNEHDLGLTPQMAT